MGRNFTDWIDAFYAYTESLPSPELFRRWAAISTIAGVVERRVWIYAFKTNVYPALYTVLVGPAGVGKGAVLTMVEQLIYEMKADIHVAAHSMTRASLADSLQDAQRNIVRPDQKPSFVSYNSLFIIASELGQLIPSYDNEFMNTLTHLWDGKGYYERKRGGDKKIEIPHAQINLFGATTPSYLLDIMPQGGWDQGFISRTILVYNGLRSFDSPFDEVELDEAGRRPLVEDLKHIAQLFGKMTFEPDAIEAVANWWKQEGPPVPLHPRLQAYNARRIGQVLKLAMIASLSARDDLIVTLEDFRRALGWMLEVEVHMPDIFKSTSGGDKQTMEDAWHYLYERYMKEKQPIAEPRLVEFVASRSPSHAVAKIIAIMEQIGLIKKVLVGNTYAYEPATRKAR